MAMILPFGDKRPVIAPDVFVAPNAVIIGDVEIGAGSSVWFGCVLRGDIGPIRIGERTNLQEGVIVHLDEGAPTVVGNDVTIGHGAIIHGVRIGDGAQIGMGAIILSHAVIGEASMIAAGAVVAERAEIPAGCVAMGIPAKVRREVTDEERRELLGRAAAYSARGARFRAILGDSETYEGD
jgi:carbonic anhydrase/acetyltransferase-like protein (isoleucine patch superfamily)